MITPEAPNPHLLLQIINEDLKSQQPQSVEKFIAFLSNNYGVKKIISIHGELFMTMTTHYQLNAFLTKDGQIVFDKPSNDKLDDQFINIITAPDYKPLEPNQTSFGPHYVLPPREVTHPRPDAQTSIKTVESVLLNYLPDWKIVSQRPVDNLGGGSYVNLQIQNSDGGLIIIRILAKYGNNYSVADVHHLFNNPSEEVILRFLLAESISSKPKSDKNS